MEGNFGSRKIWWIHCINTLVEENLVNCEILQVKIFRKTYSIKHSERLRHMTNLWHEPCWTLCSAARLPTWNLWAGVKIKYGADLAPHGPLFFTFSTSVFADSIALGGTKLLKLLVGSGSPWSYTITAGYTVVLWQCCIIAVIWLVPLTFWWHHV